jgi:hypothetical protein
MQCILDNKQSSNARASKILALVDLSGLCWGVRWEINKVRGAKFLEWVAASEILYITHAGGMNNKARLDDWRVRLAFPIFLLIDIFLKIEIIASRLFNSFRTAENVRAVLKSIYTNTDAVDDELVDIICRPGAL